MRKRGTFRRGQRGPGNPNWQGGARFVNPLGYVVVWTPEGQRTEHRVVAERVLGKPLPPGAQVHHANGDRTDNRPANLVICQDNAYHFLLERRLRAKNACGNADWIRCPYCKQYDARENMYVRKDGHGHHLACSRLYKRKNKEARRWKSTEANAAI